MIRRISDELHISTDVLIKPTRTLGGRPARPKSSIKISSVHQRKKARSALRAKLTVRSSSSGRSDERDPLKTDVGPSLNSGSRGHELDISPTAARIGMVEEAPLC
jgi:hypothetical protein